MSAQLEKKNIKVNLTNIEGFSDEYTKAKKKELRNKALHLDKKALKTLLSKNKSFEKGSKDLNEVKDIFKNKYGNSKNFENRTVEIKYSDGSSAIYSASTVDAENESNKVKTNTELEGPWGNDVDIFEGINDVSDDGVNKYSTTEWKYLTGVSYAKIKDVLHWSFDGKTDTTIDFISDQGASSYSGVVKIDIEDKENHQRDWSYDYHVVQGYTDVRFVVSDSFTADFVALSISVDNGVGWHQYAITEVVRFPTTTQGAYGVFNYAGQFL